MIDPRPDDMGRQVDVRRRRVFGTVVGYDQEYVVVSLWGGWFKVRREDLDWAPTEFREVIAPCPLCGSEGVEHPAVGLLVAGASCSNGDCILHIGYQDETNRHVRLEQWPSLERSQVDEVERILNAADRAAVDRCVRAVRELMEEDHGNNVLYEKIISAIGGQRRC